MPQYLMLPTVPPLALPTRAADWPAWREDIRATLEGLLGDFPPLFDPVVETLSTEQRGGCVVERIRFDSGDPLAGPASSVPGWLVLPEKLRAPAPAVLYLHWHGGEYALGKEQIWKRSSRGLSPVAELTSRGYIVLAIDAVGFGERQGTSPDGAQITAGAEEASWSKLNLWYGRTLWGMMLRDDRLALRVLQSRPEVDTARVAAAGISMGCTRAVWLMALDEGVRAAVAICCQTRYQELIATGGLYRHGIFYYVPGMLRHFDSEAVYALCAPRPLLNLNGALDALTPPSGIRAIDAAVQPLYTLLGASDTYRSVLYPDVGHAWTPPMWEETLTWLDRWLQPGVD